MVKKGKCNDVFYPNMEVALIWAEEFGDKKHKLRYFLCPKSHFIPGWADARGLVWHFGFLID